MTNLVLMVTAVIILFAIGALIMILRASDVEKLFGVSLLLFGLVIMLLSSESGDSEDEHSPDVSIVAASLGLVEDTSYPIEFGSILASRVETSVNNGLISRKSSVTILEEARLTASFNGTNGLTHIIELPLNRIVFDRDTSIETPTMQVSFRDALIGSSDATASSLVSFDTGIDTPYGTYEHFDPDSCTTQSFLWATNQECSEVIRRFIPSERAITQGPGPLIDEYMESVVITLTDAQYREVLGLQR